ncbi:hypothetical protein A7C99_0361 [Trichophyton rubrum]|uniref:Uncharacterized protein n=1 Tax=Trichophyton rubrum TaxID=5551 RepID=A0A178F7H9_TRIRU|nr:hypothetical protein A7C99_0361 [Trichophyton rubrum]
MRLKRFSARKYCRADLNEPLDQSPTMLTKQQSIFSSKALIYYGICAWGRTICRFQACSESAELETAASTLKIPTPP